MRFKRSARLVTIAMAATGLLGLVGIQAAAASGVLSVSPSTGLADGQLVTITLSGVVPGPVNTLQVSECGNAYGDGTPLVTVPKDATNCEVVAFVNQGNLTADPLVFNNIPILQTGIGTGNRACIAAPQPPCFVYVSTSVNQPTFPTVDLSFTNDITGALPAATTTTITPIGSPLGADKVAHADVHVVAIGHPNMRPEGSVQVVEGANVLGTGTLVDGSANVAFGMLPEGDHNLVAHFTGNGSFAASDSATGMLTVINANNVSIGDASIVEGNSGTRIAVFPVVLPKPPGSDVTVNYSVTPSGVHPASIGSDLVNLPANLAGKLIFKARTAQTIHYIKVKVASDTTPEFDETFSVSLVAPLGYALRRGVGTGTILDDDTPAATAVTVGIGDSSVPEGDVGAVRNMSLALTLSQPVTTDITTVTIQISSVTATHGPKATGDWSGKIIRAVRFTPGVVVRPVNIAVFPDLRDEYDETVSVAIIGVTVSGVAPVPTVGPHSTATGTILTDE